MYEQSTLNYVINANQRVNKER